MTKDHAIALALSKIDVIIRGSPITVGHTLTFEDFLKECGYKVVPTLSEFQKDRSGRW